MSEQSGRVFYVSQSGNDDNNGLTPNCAWKTLKNITADAEILCVGDIVLFERNGIYRGSMKLVTGVTYSAYGKGKKPQLYGSLLNYAQKELWEGTAQNNVWKLHVGPIKDVGNIVFEHGKICGTKRLENKLFNDFEFWHSIDEEAIYLHLESGNPGDEFEDIEVCYNEHIMWGNKQYTKDILIENLCLKYTGAHGICFCHGSENITVRNCEIGFIGGSMMNEEVRYGNGFEVVDGCTNILVENNWVYQCYDAGITHQSSFQPGCIQKNIVFRGNLIEYCNYSIEYYVSNEHGIIEDTVYENNILRYAGFGFGSENRIGSDTSVLSHICCYSRMMPSKNFVIRNNVLDTSLRFLTAIGCTNDKEGLGPTMVGNHYIQNSNQEGCVELIRVWDPEQKEKVAISIQDREAMEYVISKVDMAPGMVVLKNSNGQLGGKQ